MGFFSSWSKFSFLKGKEIIEYYLKQLEEEGITFVPRWTPPVACKSESSTSHPRRPVSPAINIPESATKEGLSNKEILNTSSSPSEPTAGTPDGMGVWWVLWEALYWRGSQHWAASPGQLRSSTLAPELVMCSVTVWAHQAVTYGRAQAAVTGWAREWRSGLSRKTLCCSLGCKWSLLSPWNSGIGITIGRMGRKQLKLP